MQNVSKEKEVVTIEIAAEFKKAKAKMLSD